jgi:predicted enzyme related to lactoylglutathione lyase
MKHLINWIEIPVTNMGRAKQFYGQILEAELRDLPNGEIEYAVFRSEDQHNAGALVRGKFYKPSDEGVVVYLDGGQDLNNILSRVEGAGGKVTLKKTFLAKAAGHIAYFQDTEGNRIGLQSMN